MASEWFLKEKKLFSFYDLSESPWVEVCDEGTVERHEAIEWANSESLDRENDFARLLNQSLRKKLHHLDVGYNKSLGIYYFRLPEGQTQWLEPYRSISKNTSRYVVDFYPNKFKPELPGYFRHMAFSAKFLRADSEWGLEITPTYHYTRDGVILLRRYEDLLKGIKRLERNAAVLGQVFFIADYLSRPPELFKKASELTFGQLLTFNAEVSINDSDWLKREEDEGASIKAVTEQHLSFFQ
jgi:hypothetical protein